MDIRNTILGRVAVGSSAHIQSVDVAGLVRRILLFDKVVIQSVRFREFPLLARAFRPEGLIQLLDTGILSICCEFTTLALGFQRNGVRDVPEWHFHFGVVDAHDREGVLRSELRALQSVAGLKNDVRASLENAIWKSTVRPPDPKTYGLGWMTQVECDLRASGPLLKAAVVEELRKQYGIRATSESIGLNARETSERVFLIDNKIPDTFGLPRDKVHTVLEKAVLAITNLNQRLAEMQAYSAISGFLEDEAVLLSSKLLGIVRTLTSDVAERQFERVLVIAGLPTVAAQRVNVDRLIRARESTQWREFRAWLTQVNNYDDSEIRSMVSCLDRDPQVLGIPSGAPMKFALAPHLHLVTEGLPANSIDSFITGSLLPKPGITAFLSNTYPSLFEGGETL